MCSFTAHGKRYRVSTGEADHGRAIAAASRLYAEAQLRRPVTSRRRVSHADQASLLTLSAEYLEHIESTGRSATYVAKQKMHFRAHFLRRWKRISELTANAIEKYITERSRETTHRNAAPSTVTLYKEQVTLSRFLAWCVRNGHLDAVPLIERVRPVSAYKVPDLSPADVLALLAQLPTRATHPKRHAARERFTVQWAQGLRDGEVASLRWSDVNLMTGTLTVRASNDKARQGRTVRLSRYARAVFEDLAKEPHLATALVFGSADLRVSLASACDRAGLPRITTHVFRHARLTELAGASHDTAALQYLAGHKSLATTDRYVRSRTERTTALLDAADSVNSNDTSAKKRPSTRRRERG